MIRHIVLFKLRPEGDEESMKKTRNEIRNRLEALVGRIDVIRAMEVGINIVESGRAFDIALLSTFDNLDDLETYRVHPAHREVVEYISQHKEQSAAVDFLI